jgi:hypothetical protein
MPSADRVRITSSRDFSSSLSRIGTKTDIGLISDREPELTSSELQGQLSS